MSKNKAHFDESKSISQLKEGCTEAFDELFLNYSNRLFWFVFGYLKSKEEAEEIVQDVFLKIWDQRELLNENQSFKSYLFTIAKNQIFNTLRKKVSEKKYLNFQVNFADTAHNPIEKELRLQEITQISNKAIDQLPPKRKMVFQLSRDQGMSHQEIANHLGISIKTVENHMTLALKFLRDYLKREAEITIPIILMFTHSDWL